MKAVMKVAPGVGNIELREIDEPQVADGQVKIKVHSAGLCGTDIHIFKDEFRSWPRWSWGMRSQARLLKSERV